MQIPVTLKDRSNRGKRNILLEMDSNVCIREVINLLSKRINVPNNFLKIIMCGKVLADDVQLQSLLLGPQTFHF